MPPPGQHWKKERTEGREGKKKERGDVAAERVRCGVTHPGPTGFRMDTPPI